MPDIRHAPLQFAALLLPGEVDGRSDPDSLGHAKGLLDGPVEQRRDLAQSLAELRDCIRRQALRDEQRGGRGGHHGPRQLLTGHHGPEQPDLVGIEGHAGIRPAAVLPVEANPDNPFVMALRRIEFESGRLLQAQILFLKGAELAPYRDAVSAALEKRHAGVRKLWRETIESIGIDPPRAE